VGEFSCYNLLETDGDVNAAYEEISSCPKEKDKYKMNETRLYILPLGYMENDVALNLLLYNQQQWMTNTKQQNGNEYHHSAFNSTHGLGNILVDCGSHPLAMEGYWPEDARKSTPLVRSKEDMLDFRLSQLNLSPADIDLVILTHLHLDHAGGLTYFKGTKAGNRIIAHVNEIKQALYDPFINNCQLANAIISLIMMFRWHPL